MEELSWSSEDEINLREFLKTRTGQKFLPKLAESAPGLLSEGDTNKVLIRNGQLLGYQFAIREILSLTMPAPVAQPEKPEYPDLTDDKAWNDGLKIQPQ